MEGSQTTGGGDAVATLWTLAQGTRAEDAERAGVAPARLRTPSAPPAVARPRRRIDVVRSGLHWLRHLLARGRPWRSLWPAPEPWPDPPPGLTIALHEEP